jgi:ATP-dependent DNA helicase 2 subunit 2
MKKMLGDGDQSRFDVALDSIKMLIEQKLLYATTCELGIVLTGSAKTENHLAAQFGKGQYSNVHEWRAIDKLDLDALRAVDGGLQAEDRPQSGGDVVDGLIVAMDMLSRHCGTKKYKKRVFVITDGEREAKIDDSEKRKVVTSMNEADIRLNVITLDFCDDLAEDDEDEDGKHAAQKAATKETKAQLKNKELLVDLTS